MNKNVVVRIEKTGNRFNAYDVDGNKDMVYVDLEPFQSYINDNLTIDYNKGSKIIERINEL